MPIPPTPNTARAVMSYLWDNQIVSNVFHVESGSDWTSLALQALGDALIDWAVTELIPHMTTEITLQHIDVKDISGEAGEGVIVPCTSGCTGISAGDALPNNVTLAIKWITGLSGRSFRGRTYHLGMAESQVDSNTISGAFSIVLQDAYEALLAALPTVDPSWQLVVASFVADGVPRTTGVTTPIIDVSVDPTVDSQRRRLPGRGR